jgi:hypothetical protein
MWALPVRLEMSCTIIDAIDGGIVSALLDALTCTIGKEVQGGKPWFPSLAFTGERA